MTKFFQLSIFSLFLFAQNSFAQDTTSSINESWANLKTQLQRKTHIANDLVASLSKSQKVDKEQLNNLKSFAVELFKYVDTLTHKDSLSISLANDKNDRLTQAIAKILVSVENNDKFKGNKEVIGFIMQLEGCENRIAIAKMEYNKLCKEYGRSDLFFGNDNVDKGQEVKF